jgi:outer membrane protein insertion porin family/translocation and assembly module TamA
VRWSSRIVAAALLTLAARTVAAQDDVVCDPGDAEVRRLDIVGNQTFKDIELRNRIATTQSTWTRRHLGFGKKYCLDSLTVRRDSLRFIVFYRDHGFSAVRVGLAVAPLGKGAVRVRFSITEGQPVVVDSLTIAGLDSVPEKDRIIRGLPLRQGDRFDQFALQQARDSIIRRLQERGYPEADVLREFNSDTVAHRASVTYEVLPGHRMRIGAIRITVEALRTTTDSTVRTHIAPESIHRVLGFREGQLYRESTLEGVKRNLYITEAFRHVGITIDSASLKDPVDSLVTIEVRLVEAQLNAARLSWGWGNLDCLRAQGTYSNYAFMNRLRRLDLTGGISKVAVGSPLDFNPSLCRSEVRNDPLSDTLNYNVSGTLSQTALLGLPFIPSVTLYSERRSEFQAYLRDVPFGVITSLQQGANSGLPRTYSYQLEYGSTSAQPAFFCAVFNVCEDAARERLERRERTAVLGFTATRNRASNVANPDRGSVVRFEARHASPFIGSAPDIAFNKGVVDASLYRPVLNGTLALRLRYGAVFGKRVTPAGGGGFIPLQERLYAGGPTTVRGFGQNELGPSIYLPFRIDTIAIPGNDTLAYFEATPARSGQSVVPTGGSNMVVANAELRLRSPFLPELLQWSLFTDAGQVWIPGNKAAGINFRDIRVTPGIGVRYFSPVGPVRLDVGYNAYASPPGPAYYNPLLEGIAAIGDVRLICVSPGNNLRVRLGDATGTARTPPRQIDEGNCPGTYAPARSKKFLSRLKLNFSIGQAF